MHRPIAAGVVRALDSIFREGRPADKVIEFSFKSNRKWGSRDRRLFAETVYEIVRHWRALLWQAGIDWPADDRPSAFENEHIWRVLAVYGQTKEIEIAGAPEASIRPGVENQARAVRFSFPDWLDAWAGSQTSNWDELAAELNLQAPVFLRANRLKTSATNLLALLEKRNLKVRRLSEETLQLEERANVFAVEEFQAGLFEVQDLHSQMIAPLLDAQPGHRVIDACAGAGGKTLHLASLMANKGKIVALDVHEYKLEELRRRARRAGAHLIETKLIDSAKTIKRLENSADRLLLDVPCSGLGVLRRNPDAKWRLTRERVKELEDLQTEILTGYWRMVKPGGILVYSTCSLAHSENEQQIRRFLEHHSEDFELDKEISWRPREGDGFYACRLKRRLNVIQ